MADPLTAVVGDWVRFYQAGVLVVGVVEYVTDSSAYGEQRRYLTNVGPCDGSQLIEVRAARALATEGESLPPKGDGYMHTHHWKHGLKFTRQDNGNVMLELPGTGGVHVITAAEWCSIVASMSVTGDSATTYAHAEELHMRDPRA